MFRACVLALFALVCAPLEGLERQTAPGAVLARFVDLTYPREALERRVQGFVVLRLNVAASGQVQSSEVLHGDPLLATAATGNANSWVFRPGTQGQPLVVYRFEIDDGWCNDPRASLFRLRFGRIAQLVRAQMLATVTACSPPDDLTLAPWPNDDLRVINRPGIDYPPIANSARVQGIVIVRVTIGGNGRVSQAQLLHEAPLLQDAVLANARRWEFEPTTERDAILVYEFANDLPGGCQFRSVDGLTFPRYVKVSASPPCVDY